MRKLISAFVLFVIITLQIPSLFAEQDIYLNGKVVTISKDKLTIDITTGVYSYSLAPNVRIVKHIKKRGSIYEEPAKFQEIKQRDIVTIKINERKVKTEIILEQYHEKR